MVPSVLPLLGGAAMSHPHVSGSDDVCRPRSLECLYLVPGVQERRYFPQLLPVVRPNDKGLPILELLLQFMLEVLVFEEGASSLKAVLTIDDPKLSVFDLRPVSWSGAGGEPLRHHAHRLSVPLDVADEIIYLPLDAFWLAGPHHPLVWGLFTLETVHVEGEMATHGPAVLRVLVEISKYLGRSPWVRLLSFLQWSWHFRSRAGFCSFSDTGFFHVLPRPLGGCRLPARALGKPARRGNRPGRTS